MSRKVEVTFSVGPGRHWTQSMEIETQAAPDRFVWLMEMAGVELNAIGMLDETMSRRHPRQAENVGEP